MRIRSRFIMRLLGGTFWALIALLFRTLRLKFREETPGTNPYDTTTTERFLYCVWHDSMVIPAFAGQHRGTCALTSNHADGSFVAEVLCMVGITPIRGSTNRMGPIAFRELLTAAHDGHVVITPDGPRGPARVMTAGIVYVASRTGRAIIPTAYICKHAWKIRGSWTDLLIPQPFSHVDLLAGLPIRVPPDLSSEQLRCYIAIVQAAMDRLHLTGEGRNSGIGLAETDSCAPKDQNSRRRSA